MKQKHNKQRNELGFASIVIALVLVIVLSLLTIAFAQLARREQKSALDKQLASQAYFAAESGINDVIRNLDAIRSPAIASTIDEKKCLDATQLQSIGLEPDVNKNSGVSYSCVIADIEPPEIVYSNVGVASEKATKFSTSGALSTLTVKWGSADGKSTPRPVADGVSFPAYGAAWGNSPAVLQVSITKFPDNFGRDDLIENTFTTYLYPGGSGGDGQDSVDFTNNLREQGKIIRSTTCGAGGVYPCAVTINNINGAADTNYLIRIVSFYDKSNIEAGDMKAGIVPVDVKDGQIKIDVTGRARDVLKRVSVRAPLSKIPDTPGVALEGQSLCKRELVDTTAATPDRSTPAFAAACDPYLP